MLNRSKIWALMLLLGVFAAGVSVGGPVWSFFGEKLPAERGQRDSSSGSRARERRSYSEDLQEFLGLTIEQRATVDSLLDANQSEMRAVWQAMRSQIDTLRQDVANEIMRLLDEEQRTKYSEMIARSRRRGDRERASRENRSHD